MADPVQPQVLEMVTMEQMDCCIYREKTYVEGLLTTSRYMTAFGWNEKRQDAFRETMTSQYIDMAKPCTYSWISTWHEKMKIKPDGVMKRVLILENQRNKPLLTSYFLQEGGILLLFKQFFHATRAYPNPFHTDDIFVGYAVIAKPRCTAIAFH